MLYIPLHKCNTPFRQLTRVSARLRQFASAVMVPAFAIPWVAGCTSSLEDLRSAASAADELISQVPQDHDDFPRTYRISAEYHECIYRTLRSARDDKRRPEFDDDKRRPEFHPECFEEVLNRHREMDQYKAYIEGRAYEMLRHASVDAPEPIREHIENSSREYRAPTGEWSAYWHDVLRVYINMPSFNIRVSINSSPSGADYTLRVAGRGKIVETNSTNSPFHEISRGSYVLTIRKYGYQPIEDWSVNMVSVTVEAIAIECTLAPLESSHKSMCGYR